MRTSATVKGDDFDFCCLLYLLCLAAYFKRIAMLHKIPDSK